MSGRADVRIYFERDQGLARAFQLLVDRKGELYTFTHGLPLRMKHSHHSSGYSKITGLDFEFEARTGDLERSAMQPVERFRHVTGATAGEPPEFDPALKAKSDSKRAGRRSIVIPGPRLMWGCDAWAVAPGKLELAQRIASTAPYRESEILGSFLVDWLSPMLLVTIWGALTADAYSVIKYSPMLPGHTPFLQVPMAWEETWLEEAYFASRRTIDPRLTTIRAQILAQRAGSQTTYARES